MHVFKDHYNTDLVANRSFGYISQAAKSKNPFFLAIAPVAPHAHIDPGVGSGPPVPAPKYKDYFPDAKVPRTENFNPDRVSSSSSSTGVLPAVSSLRDISAG